MATVSVRPAKLHFKITRGDDFSASIEIQEEGVPVDVSDRTYTAQLRSTPDGDLVATFSVDMTNAATGVIVPSLTDAVTEDLDGAYVWDLQQETAGGVIRTVAGGNFEVAKDVTR